MRTTLWTEVYRPNTLDNLVLSEDNRNVISSYIKKKEIPHLIFYGPSGTGKTSVARIIVDALDAECALFNASLDRGIDIIREEVYSFAKSRSLSDSKIIWFDEASQLTFESQKALKNLMDSYAENCRFIFTCNYFNRIHAEIKSRCVALEFSETPTKERFKILLNVFKEEGVLNQVDKNMAWKYAETYSDMRTMLFKSQVSLLKYDKLKEPYFDKITGDHLYQLVKDKDWNSLLEVTKQEGIDYEQLLIGLFWAIPDSDPRAATLRFRIGEAIHKTAHTPDQVVHFLGTLSGLIDEIS